MAALCRVTLLGGFRVEVGGRPIPEDAWRHRRSAELVELLALAPSHRLHREQAIEALWPDLGPEAGGANLRKAVHFARRALGGEVAVGTEAGMVSLWPRGALRVDAEDFEAAATDALRRKDPDAASRADQLYGGDLLPEEPYADWAYQPRDRLRRLHLRALRMAGRWERVVELDPLDEDAHRGLMRHHLEEGNRQAAIRQFERLRQVLRDELGVGPDPHTVSLYEEILALEGTEPSTPGERAAAHLSAGLVALNRMDLEEAERQARLARGLATEAGLGRELGEASGLLGMVGHSRRAWPELFRQEFLQTIQEAPDLAEFVFDAHLCLAEFSLHGEEGPEDVAAYARGLLEIADRFESVHGRALATLILGESELLLGDLASAESDLSRAAELHGKAGASSGRALALQRLAQAALARGRRARALRLLADADALAAGSTLASHLQVRIQGTMVRAVRDPTAAADIAQAAGAGLAGSEVCEPCSMDFLLASVAAFARVSRVREATEALRHAERVAGMWQGGPWAAALWETRAEFRGAQGERRQAAALFREAADQFARCGHRAAEERCRHRAEASEVANASTDGPEGARARNARGTPAS